MRTHWLCIALVAAVACDRTIADPGDDLATLDIELRSSLRQWGAMPIGPLPSQNPALVSLGQSLFFDKLLSGNRDVSCATCHDALLSASDGLTLAIGTGAHVQSGVRSLGEGRQFVPRNAPSLVNQGLAFFYTLWDGRVNEEGTFNGGPIKGPAGITFPSGLTNIIAAQAMLPVLNRVEMRGNAGDIDAFGNANELAQISDASPAEVWKAAMQRLLAVQEYVAKFNAAFPGTPASALGFQHAANALAAFQASMLTRTSSKFDRYLAHEDEALTAEQKRGGILFFGKGQCVTCHSGPLLGGQQFSNIGTPQVGPGVGAAAPLDIGRGEHLPGISFYNFSFRVPPLRNVALTAPYMHNGAYRTLDAVLAHYTNADSAQKHYDVTQLDPALRGMHHGDAATLARVNENLDFRLRQGIKLTLQERKQIIAFLESLTDDGARALSTVVPASVPSGLPIR
jgi:cytochrome c peroxidase